MVDMSRAGELMLERNSPRLQNLGLRLKKKIVAFLTQINDRFFIGFLISQNLRLIYNRGKVNSAVRIKRMLKLKFFFSSLL